MLKAYLVHYVSDRYYIGRSYLSTEVRAEIDPIDEVRQCLKQYDTPVQVDELCDSLSHITEDRVRFILGSNGEFVRNSKGEYFHVDSLDLTEEELENIAEIIEAAVEKHEFISGNELYDAIQNKYPYTFEKNAVFSVIGWRDALKYKLADRFSFVGNIVSRAGTSLSMSDVFTEYGKGRQRFSLDELEQFADSIGTTIYFDSLYTNAIRISHQWFVSKDSARFSVKETDAVLERFCDSNYMPISAVTEFAVLPDAAFPWTEYLLEQYIAFFSEKFYLMHGNYGPENENPLLTIDMLWEFFYDKGRDMLAHDIRSVLDYFTRSSNQRLDPEEKRILKTVLLLQAISQHAGDSVELFIPNEKNVDSAFEGTDLDGGASRIAERLVRDKVLFHKQLGGGKFQYAAYVNEVSDAELEKYKEDVDKKTTTSLITEQLVDKTTVTEAVTLGGALKLRYELRYVSASDFDQAIRVFRNREAELENKIPAVVCFAKDDKEASLISKKIKEALQDGSYHVVFIDATTTPFGNDGYEQYRNEMANAMYQQGKDGTLSGQYANNAKDALKKWKNRIASGEFIVFTEKKPAGERATTMEALFSVLQAVNKDKFQRCLEAAYSVLPTMFTPSALKLGVECGATRTTRQTFSSGNVNTKLETALKEAWDDPEYWNTHPNLLISQIKQDVDRLIRTAFDKESGRVSIRAIYDMLKAKPYGFMPCNMTAFIMGFVLKEYTNGSYSWSDGLTNDVMDLNKLKEMVNEIISLQITPNPRYKDKYIVEMTEAEKSFNETTSYAFGIPLNLCTSVEQTRERIRNKMKEFSFPIWTIKSVLPSMELKTDRAILEELIDSYCGIANSNNMGKSKTDSDIALAIGDLSAKNPEAKEDLRALLTKDNCTAGMRTYVREFEGGELVSLAEEIGDNGQFINVLRSKFDADAANWVWNVETAQQKIREVILEYRIIAESNKVLPKNVSFSSTIREWCDKCGLIRISYAAAKNYLGDVAPFLELLHAIKKAGTILDSQKQKFLDLLIAHADEFNAFYSNQVELFKKVCAYYLDGLSDEEVRALYQTIPVGTFTNDKTEYMNRVDLKAKDYRNSLGNERLKKLWKDKTGSVTPRQWSKEHLMPILCLVPDREVQTARVAFGAVNNNHPDASSIEKAINYLENASFYSLMNDQEALDRIFRETIIKSFSVMLTDIDEVKSFLNSRISSEPYEWFGLPEVDKKLEQMAEDKYVREGCTRALEKIDDMDVGDVKRYLKELIKDNMIVGMEIIKEN